MICPNCGFENEPGARFCKRCGTPLAEAQPSAPPQVAYTPQQYAPPQAAYPPPQGAYPPPYTDAPAPKKKGKTGLIIGICAGVLVIVGVVLVLLLLNPFGPSVAGYWVAEDEGMVLSIDKGGELTMYSLAGSSDADYDFDKGEGGFKADDVKYEFTLDDDRLKLTNGDTDETVKFTRAKDEPDIEAVVTAPLLGMWTSEEMGEVLELKTNGKFVEYGSDGDYTGTFEFDINKGEGTVELDGTELAFIATADTLTLEEYYIFTKASDSLDVAAFIAEHSNPLLGTWYDISGMYGTIDFYEDGTYIASSYGSMTYGTYTFDLASGSGDLTSDSGGYSTMSYYDGSLEIDGVYFTLDYVEQLSVEELYGAVLGEWYEATGAGNMTFYADGTYDLYYYDTYYWGDFTFDAASYTGTITLDTGETLNFSVYTDTLYLEDIEFARTYVDTSSSVEGTWYDSAGEAGTLDFYSDGTVYAYTYGEFLYGTFEYDSDLGYGTIWFDYNGDQLIMYIYIDAGYLVLSDESSSVYIYYTQDYVYQNN